MKRVLRRFVLLSLVFFLSPFAPRSLSGVGWAVDDEEDSSPSSYGERLSEIQSLQREYEEKVADLQSKERTLSNQIEQMDSEIYLTALRIQESEAILAEKSQELKSLEGDLEKLGVRIQRLSESLDYQEQVFRERARASYKTSSITPLELFLGGENLSEMVLRYKYLQVLEEQDRELLWQMIETQENYQRQQDFLIEKKAEVEVIRAQVETQQIALQKHKEDLDVQRADRQQLLTVTQRDEGKYQELLAQILAERAAIESAVAELILEDGEEVEAGDPIALMGNSGAPYCSTGAHLHFEVRRDGSVQDPSGYLRDQDVEYEDNVASMSYDGDWEWPMRGTVWITQEYGMSFWARTSGYYGGGPHTGIDMVSTSNIVIYAPADGTLYHGTSSYCQGLKLAAVDHGDGVMSYYLHVQ